jgi:hypothetical protein
MSFDFNIYNPYGRLVPQQWGHYWADDDDDGDGECVCECVQNKFNIT